MLCASFRVFCCSKIHFKGFVLCIATQWLNIFSEADELGISFILLAGGEPMLRRDLIEAAGKRQNILFPIFTNGTFIDKTYFALFDRCRNLIPIMSIEGEKQITDERRGTMSFLALFRCQHQEHISAGGPALTAVYSAA